MINHSATVTHKTDKLTSKDLDLSFNLKNWLFIAESSIGKINTVSQYNWILEIAKKKHFSFQSPLEMMKESRILNILCKNLLIFNLSYS